MQVHTEGRTATSVQRILPASALSGAVSLVLAWFAYNALVLLLGTHVEKKKCCII
jgi:hypothetical protein